MKKIYVASALLLLVLVAGLVAYRYVYLPHGSCIQVVVSATNRITGASEVFGSPCSIPFWYTNVRGYNPESVAIDQSRVYTVKEVLSIMMTAPDNFKNKKVKIQAVYADAIAGLGCNDYMILMDKDDAVRKQQLMEFLTKAEMDEAESESIRKELQSLPRIQTGEALKMPPGVFPTEYGIYQGHFYDTNLSRKCSGGSMRFVIEKKIQELNK